MKISKLILNIVIILLILVAIFVVWKVLISKSGTTESTAPGALEATNVGSTTENSILTDASDREFLDLVISLESIKLDESIFTDSRFTQLQDMTAPAAQEPLGRANPFGTL